MANDLYAPCPCGSGKKFKWCCSEIWGDIEKAYETFSNGQAETALVQMRQIQKNHPTNPECHGRLAELLLLAGDLNQAEKELESAFKINPQYPFGLYLQAALRIEEGEWEGALILLRKAAQYYPADSKEDITRVYNLIFRCEMNRNRPIAAKAALKIAARYAPPESGAKELLEQFGGPESRMPKTAKMDLELLPCMGKTPVAETAEEAPKLGDLPAFYRGIIQENNSDNNAKYNLGVSLAWLGQNKESIIALEEYIKDCTDPAQYRKAATLVEILKFSAGMESESDYINYHLGVPLSNPETVGAWLNDLQQTRRILPLFQDKESGSITFFLLEESSSGLITTGSTAKEFSKVIGYLALYPTTLVAWSYDSKKIENLKLEILTRLQVPLNQVVTSINISDFAGILLPSAVIPLGTKDKDHAKKIARDQMLKYFEETWFNQPRKSLGGKSPSEASKDVFYNKKLQGLMDLYEEVVATQDASLFDFNIIRKKLSILGDSTPANNKDKPGNNLNVSDLGTLSPPDLDLNDLVDAFRKAQSSEEKGLAAGFAKEAIQKGIAADNGAFPIIIKTLAEHLGNEGDLDETKKTFAYGIQKANQEGLDSLATDFRVAEIKLLGKLKDTAGLNGKLDEFLANPSEEDKLFIAFAETFMRLNLKESAKKICEAGMKMAKSKNKGDLAGFFQDMLQSLGKN